VGVRAFGAAGFAAPAFAQTSDLRQPSSTKWRLELEYQRFDTVTNVIRKGDDGTGTRFEATDYTGSQGNEGRLSAFVPVSWFWKGDELRLVIAPFQQSGTTTPTTPILYDGGLFRAGVPLTVLYKFNTYRITYDAPIFESLRDDEWEFRLGGTLAVRDAQIKLSQPVISRNFTNWTRAASVLFRGQGPGRRLAPAGRVRCVPGARRRRSLRRLPESGIRPLARDCPDRRRPVPVWRRVGQRLLQLPARMGWGCRRQFQLLNLATTVLRPTRCVFRLAANRNANGE
jgi:hypothetical protein